MSSCLSDKKCRVVVVDASASGRQVMVDVVRKLGFDKVEGRPSIVEVLQFLETEAADWLIVPLMADQPVNGLHLLRLISENPELKGLRVSLLVSDEEMHVLPAAFAHGLLSFHPRAFTKEILTEEFTKLTQLLQDYQASEPRIAAHYLRTYLKASKQFDTQIELEKGLLDLFPGDVKILMNMVEPLFHTNKHAEAKKTLAQVKMLDPKLEDSVKNIGKGLFGADYNANTDGGGEGGISVIGVEQVVMIDSDDTVASGVEDILKNLGVKTVHRFADGVSAAAFLETNVEPQLIIMEWRVPKLSGPMLLQRIRQTSHLGTPVVVLSSLLKAEDMPLVKEMGVASVINKPVNKDLLVPGLIWMMQQERLPTEQQTLERKIRSLLTQDKLTEAEDLRVRYMAGTQISLGRKRQMEAEFAFATGNYPLARDAGVESLKISGDSILVLNLLGKSFMRLSNFDAALKCFKKAQEMSPHNIERLCNIAEVQTELGDIQAASETLDHAKALDPDSQTTAEAEVKVAVIGGDTSAAKKLMGELDSLNNIVSYMNNKAVAHAKCNEPTEAIDLYRKTVESIPDDRVETKAIVLYNAALAQARAGDLPGALAYTEQSLTLKSAKIEKRALSLRTRLKTSIDSGQAFRLLNDGAAAAEKPDAVKSEAALASEDDLRRLMAKVDAKRGELCCFLVFHAADDSRVKTMMANPPRFGRRSGLARQESFAGGEGMKKQAS